MCEFCEFKGKRKDISHPDVFYALWLNKPNKRDAEKLMHDNYTLSDQEGTAIAVIKFCPMCGRDLRVQ